MAGLRSWLLRPGLWLAAILAAHLALAVGWGVSMPLFEEFDEASHVLYVRYIQVYHALPVQNVFRDDEPRPSLPVAEALANAPDRRTDARGEQFYAVPAVLE